MINQKIYYKPTKTERNFALLSKDHHDPIINPLARFKNFNYSYSESINSTMAAKLSHHLKEEKGIQHRRNTAKSIG